MAISVPFGLNAPTAAPSRRELRRELHVGEAAQPVGGEQAALPRTRPDDRVVDDRAALDLFVRPDTDVRVHGHARAEHDLAADYAALFEQAAVLDRDRAADHGATQARVEADIRVVPQDRVGDLGARIDGRVAADHGRPVDPGSRTDLRSRADQRRPVDPGAFGDVSLGVDPDVLALSLAGDVDLHAALEAIEV